MARRPTDDEAEATFPTEAQAPQIPSTVARSRILENSRSEQFDQCRRLGVRLGNWLSDQQSLALWQAPNVKDLKGKRDRALLALLLACGLRRHEAVALRLEHLEQREGHWAIVDLKGKGGHVRTVPVPGWVMEELRV